MLVTAGHSPALGLGSKEKNWGCWNLVWPIQTSEEGHWAPGGAWRNVWSWDSRPLSKGHCCSGGMGRWHSVGYFSSLKGGRRLAPTAITKVMLTGAEGKWVQSPSPSSSSRLTSKCPLLIGPSREQLTEEICGFQIAYNIMDWLPFKWTLSVYAMYLSFYTPSTKSKVHVILHVWQKIFFCFDSYLRKFCRPLL